MDSEVRLLYIEIGLLIVMVVGMCLYFFNRKQVRKSGGSGDLGLRGIQFFGIIMIVPTVIFLTMEGDIHGETIAALFGTLIGFLLAAIQEILPQEK